MKHNLDSLMFRETDEARATINVQALGAKVQLVNVDGEPIHQGPHEQIGEITLAMPCGIHPTEDMFDVLKDICGDVGAQDICDRIRKHSIARRLIDAIQ